MTLNTFSLSHSQDFLRSAASATPTPTPTPAVTKPTIAESADGSWVFTSSGSLTDAAGQKWTITTGKQVAVNGKIDTQTANAVLLYYHGHQVHHMNTSRGWYAKSPATVAWAFVPCPVPNS